MLTIRNEQLDRLDGVQRLMFCDRAMALMRSRYAAESSGFDDDQLRATVLLALRRTREHGITRQADILRYINVMFTLGCDFEDDPDYPWAREIMNHPRMRGGSKINQLVERTHGYLLSLGGRT